MQRSKHVTPRPGEQPAADPRPLWAPVWTDAKHSYIASQQPRTGINNPNRRFNTTTAFHHLQQPQAGCSLLALLTSQHPDFHRNSLIIMQKTLHTQAFTQARTRCASGGRCAQAKPRVLVVPVKAWLQLQAAPAAAMLAQSPAAAAVMLAPLQPLPAATAAPSHVQLGELVALAAQQQLQLRAPQPGTLVGDSRKAASRMVLPVLAGKPTPPIVLQRDSETGALRVVSGSEARLASLLAFVSAGSSCSSSPWPAAPVELDSRDEAAFIAFHGKTFASLPVAVQQRVAAMSMVVLPPQA